jgi:DNA-binding MarR family transcriptional regulator
MPESFEPLPHPLLELNCACASIRRTARLVTQLYSHEMGGAMEPAQFSLLSVLNRRPGATQTSLGRALGMDKTTASRNLRLMRKHGWIESDLTDDRRERRYHVTAAGKRILTATEPGWKRAQRKLRAALKPGEWENMLTVLRHVDGAALAARREAMPK